MTRANNARLVRHTCTSCGKKATADIFATPNGWTRLFIHLWCSVCAKKNEHQIGGAA